MKTNQLIDNLKIYLSSQVIDDFKKRKIRFLIKSIDDSIKFDFGDKKDCPEKKGNIVDLPMFPFESMFVEMLWNNKVHGVLFSDVGAHIHCVLFTDHNNESIYTLSDISALINKEDGTFTIDTFFDDGYHDENYMLSMRNEVSGWLASLFVFINVMNCSNVEFVDNIPSKLKQSRIKKGKTKLFEYKTLHIKANSKKNINKGEGKHSSPRIHLRRGHIRKCASGITTWVQSCVVGSKKGMIHKDYKVEAA